MMDLAVLVTFALLALWHAKRRRGYMALTYALLFIVQLAYLADFSSVEQEPPHEIDWISDDAASPDDERVALRGAATTKAEAIARHEAEHRRSHRVVARKARAHHAGSVVASGAVWDRLADCESGDRHVPGSARWNLDTGNGYRGGLQFAQATWEDFGGLAYAPSANLATRAQQIEVAKRTQAKQGWGAWPDCSRFLGLR